MQEIPSTCIRQMVGTQCREVLQNEADQFLWDFKIQTDKHPAHNIPDITMVEKKQVWLIDVTIP